MKDDPVNEDKVSYDINTNTLTLKGAQLKTEMAPKFPGNANPNNIAIVYYQGYDPSGEDSFGPFTINLIGENTIDEQSSSQEYSSAIWVASEDLNITGSGSLESNLQNKGITICTKNTDLSIQSDLTIHLPKTNGAGISTGTGGSAQSSGKIDITDASVTITADGGAEGSTAIHLCNGITCKNSHVIASCESGQDGRGIYGVGNIKLDANSTFEVIGGLQALIDIGVDESTKKNLGLQYKEDLSQDYQPWSGEDQLDFTAIKAVKIPGYQVTHVKAKDPTGPITIYHIHPHRNECCHLLCLV